MANTHSTLQWIGKQFTPMFWAATPALQKGATTWAQYFEEGERGFPPGSTVEVRLRPTFEVQELDGSVNGPLTIPSNFYQDRTVPLTLGKFQYVKIDLNAIEHYLRVGNEQMIRENFIKPAVLALKKKANNLIYDEFVKKTYYQTLNGGAPVSTQLPVNLLSVVMTDAQIDPSRYLGLSTLDNGFLSAQLGAYFQGDVSDDGALRGLVHPQFAGFETYMDDSIREFEAGTINTLTDLTLGADALNGAITITIASASLAGKTAVVGDSIAVTNTAYFFVAQVDRKKIDPTRFPVILKVAPYTQSAANADWDPVTQTYTAAGATMVVEVSRTIDTDLTITDNFGYINAKVNSGTIASGTTLQMRANARYNMGVGTGGILVASPPIERVLNSEFHIEKIDNLSVVVAAQGSLPQLSNTSFIGFNFGTLCLPQYTAALLAN